MSGGMEDAARQDNDEFVQGPTDGTSARGQEPIDFQQLQHNASESTAELIINASDASESEVPSSQEGPRVPAPNNNTDAAGQPPSPMQGFELSTLMAQITSVIAQQYQEIKEDLQKKERDAEVKRAADRAELLALTSKFEAAKAASIHEPPVANINVPACSTSTPTSKQTFASAASTSNTASAEAPPGLNKVPPSKNPQLPQLNSRQPAANAMQRKPINPPPNHYLSKRSLFQSTRPSEGNARAQIIRNVPSSTKYRPLLPEDYANKISTKQGLFPVNQLYEDPPEGDEDLLWIRVSGYGSKIGELRDPLDDSEISYAAVGHMIVDAARLVDQHHTLELAKAFETKITRERNDDKCMGVVAVRLHSEYNKTTFEKLNKAREIIQTIIYTEAHLRLEDSDLPKYVKAFAFEISPVNYPYFIVFGLLHGVDAQWYDRHDYIAFANVMDDIHASIQVELPKSLRSSVHRSARLGALCYSTSSATINGENGKIIALAYAANVSGYQAALDLFEIFRDTEGTDSGITLCGGLPVSMECFPPRNGRQKGTKKKSDAITVFSRTTVLANHEYCNENFKVIDIKGLTKAIFNRKSRTNAIVNYKPLHGIVARVIKTKVKDSFELVYKVSLVLSRSTSTVTCNQAFFRQFYLEHVPEWFPINIDNNPGTNDDYTLVVGRGGRKPNPDAFKSNLKTSLANLNRRLVSIEQAGRVWVVKYGRGGRRGSGVFFDFTNGCFGAEYVWRGVSGASIRAYDNENDAWADFELSFPGVNSIERLRAMHMAVPHTETNLSPTWSEHDGRRFHAEGADAFTYTEADDTEMVISRMAATLAVTGEENGQIDQRRHFFASYFDPEAPPAYPPTTENDGSNEEDLGNSSNNGNTNENNSTDDTPNSQDFFPGGDDETNEETQDGSADSGSKSRNGSPTKKRRVDGEDDDGNENRVDDFDASTLAQPKPNSVYETSVVLISSPEIGSLADFKGYLNHFKAGLGNWWPGQLRMGRYVHFPQCQVAILLCPRSLTRQLRWYIHTNKMWGKWQLYSTTTTNEAFISYIEPDPKWESIAADGRIQYVKAANHPKHDAFLATLLRTASDPQEIFDHFIKEWKAEAIDGDGKALSEEWRSPAPATDFDPSKWIPLRPAGSIDPSNFDGMDTSF